MNEHQFKIDGNVDLGNHVCVLLTVHLDICA
jgi:hypothetical protein